MKTRVFLFFLLFALSLNAQVDRAYTLFDGKGKKVSYKKMEKAINEKDIVLFGELHNNPIAHWLQLELTQTLGAKRPLVLGAEMLEADNQLPVNEYLSGAINQKALDTLARLWPNHKTDYRPLLDYAKKHQLPFVATNVPRRYANQVFKKGFNALDSLSEEEKAWIAPLPILFDPNLPRYQYILEMMGEHGSPKLVMAQAIKDATMAHFILQNRTDNSLFIHYNGAFHSDFYEGIYWYLKQANPGLRIITISTVSQKSIDKLEEEHLGKADFIICVDEDMTTTH